MAINNCQPKYMGNRRRSITEILESEGVQYLLSGEETKVPLSSIHGKMICLYFSASWCRPCRSFTPQLLQLYNKLRKSGKNLEIIFVSFDRDEEGFREHLRDMAWLAIPFDVDLHRRLSDTYRLDHIPSLIPLDSDGILLTEEDAVGMIEDYGADAFPFTTDRRDQLKAMDDSKRQEGKLEELLAHEGRNYLISGCGRQALISELVGKTIGLYFGASWCPPCLAFTTQLKDVYNELVITTSQCFEVVFVSTDRDSQEFCFSIGTMPWLAVPYEDKTRQDLCRIFDIKRIPALILLGPDRKALSLDGRAVIALHGARAFPFTESRIEEIETALKKEGDGLPQRVKDPKHEHVLKLDMAKAYLCDYCKKHGRFWAFSCGICDYDLHPTCVEETF